MVPYKTTAPGGGSARTVPLKPANVREAATGGRVPVERRNVPSPIENYVPPFPHAWPFDPTDTSVVRMRPRPLWAMWKAFKRYAASEAGSEHALWVLTYVLGFCVLYYAYTRGL